MKNALRNFGILAGLGVFPFACEPYNLEVDAAQNMCAQMGWVYNDKGELVGSKFDFLPVGTDPVAFWTNEPPPAGDGVLNPPMGSFEPGTDEAGEPLDFYIGDGALIVDDDDLTDDYPIWQEALKLAERLMAEDPAALKTYAGMDPEKPEDEYTAEESEAVAFVEELVTALLPLCKRLADPDATGIPPRPGDDLTKPYWPSFTACKDKYNASGDGVLGTFQLRREGGQEQDVALSQCPTISGGRNRNALNVWGPLSTTESSTVGLPSDVIDGFTYSGVTVPLESSPWKRTIDRSDWEGVAFWARLANASEAVPIGPTPRGIEPMYDRGIPEGARPQDGVGQLGIIVQTFDTGAVYNLRGEMDFMNQVGVCEGEQTPEDTLCFGTQEEFDAFPGLEVDLPEGQPPKKYAYRDATGFNPDPDVAHGPGRPTTPEVPLCLDYSPTDSLPGKEASFRDQCWDGFRTMLEITPEWKFYFVPFSEMRQAGWGRVAKSFRLDQLRSVNLLTSAYQPVNVMVDEITFYRRNENDKGETFGLIGAGGAN